MVRQIRQFAHNVVISTSNQYITTVYVDCVDLAAKVPLLSAYGGGSCDTQRIHLLGQMSGIDEMSTDHLKLLDCLSFHKEVERTALICDHF